MERVFIHYGAKKFDTERFKPIKNSPYRNKPSGGFWASDIDAPIGWKEWTERVQFRTEHYTEDNCFRFRLSENTKIITLACIENVEELPQLGYDEIIGFRLDFETIMKMGYDVIDYRLSDDNTCGFRNIYWCLYGWDCDSILVLNPNVIIPI